MSINKMSHTRKKWLSLFIAVILVSLVSLVSVLIDRSNREAEQAVHQKATNEAASLFLKQGEGKIRKWGEKPADAPAKGADHAKK